MVKHSTSSPDEFKPERFLHDDGSLTSDTMSLGLGWSRRMCAGHVADPSLWIAMASYLAIFSTRKSLDDHGIKVLTVAVESCLSLRLAYWSLVISIIQKNVPDALSCDSRVHQRT
ncbi:hypothetical protein BDR07DRAFT_1360214 [Suillus spraguei]|nr:hypothetical protein BDR07DRAFT_1360214 [Suillus spraguei]